MKKAIIVIAIVLGSLLALGGVTFALLLNDRVDTYIAHVAAEKIGEQLGTRVEIGDVSYCFPARIRIKDLYLEDQQGDTLAFIREAYAHFRPLALKNKEICFARVDVIDAYASVHRLSDSTYNYEFLVIPTDTTQPPQPFRAFVSVKDVRVEHLRARFDDYHGVVDYAYMDLYHLTSDSLDAEIRDFSAHVYQGNDSLRVESLQARLVQNDTIITMPKLYLKLPNTELDASGVRFEHPTKDILQDVTERSHDVRFDLQVHTAEVVPRDLSLLAPAIKTIDKPIRLQAAISGTLDSVEARNLTLYYNNKRWLLGNATALGLPDIRNPYLRVQCQDLSVSAAQIQDFLSDVMNRPYKLPDQVQRLGMVHYRGQAEGQLHDVTLHGAFQTAEGIISTDGRLASDSSFHELHYEAEVATNKFHVGRVLAHRPLGTISLDAKSEGTVIDGKPEGVVNAHISDVHYGDYIYKEISIDGQFSHNRYDGRVNIDDENIKLRFAGLVDLQPKQPDINFDLRLSQFRPGVMNLSPRLEDTEVALSMAVSLSGIDPDQMNGYLVIDSLKLRNGQDSSLMQQLKVIVEADDDLHKKITLNSDYLTAGAEGQFQYKSLPMSALYLLSKYLPSSISNETLQKVKKYKPQGNYLDFYANGHKLRSLQRVLNLPVTLRDNPVIKGYMDEQKELVEFDVFAPGLKVGKTMVNDLSVSLNNDEGKASLLVTATANNLACSLQASAESDSIASHIELHQVDSAEHIYGGDVNLGAHFVHYNGEPLITMRIHPSVVQLRDTAYLLSGNSITYCKADATVAIDGFKLESEKQYLRANGVLSSNVKDSLRIDLSHIDAGYILPFVLPEKTLKLDGDLSGWATLYGIFSNPVFEADVQLDSAKLNDTYVGNAIAKVALDKQTHNVMIDGDVIDGSHLVAHVDGEVVPSEHTWGIMIYPDSIPLGFINHWTSGIISDIAGFGSGKVHVHGRGPNTWVEAKVKAIDGALTVPFTGCRYYLSDSVTMDSTSIRFDNIDLFDEESHRVHFNGAVNHTNFRDFNFLLDAQVYDAMALNLPDKAGEMLQGRVYASGDVHIEGDEKNINISANAKTVGKSRFRLSIDYASTAGESNFIHFVNHDSVPVTVEEDEEDEVVMQPLKVQYNPGSRVMLSINADVTQQLLFQLMLSSSTGDMIQARGDGALRFTYDSQTSDTKLMGTYLLQSGSFDFTIANMIRRNFEIATGSTIAWSGDPIQPQLNVTAKYHVTPSLKDLFGDEISEMNLQRTNVPVNTCLTMTGNLMQPTFKFGLEFPTSTDNNLQDRVRSVINTDEMLMRQVVYLLVFGKFFTPEYLTTTQFTGLNETYSLLSSTLTGQINSWINKLTDAFTMGVNIRSEGVGSDASQEYEAQFHIQPVDRLLINGNVGYRYNDISNRPFFGDLDVEVLLTEDGKLRLKGYTHSVDKYSLRQASTIQGVGLVWKYDFNWPTKEDIENNKILREQRKAEKQARKERLKQEKLLLKQSKKTQEAEK